MNAEPDWLPIAVRAFAPPPPKRPRRRRSTEAARKQPKNKRRWSPGPQRYPEALLVLDTETTVDAAQALIVGAYRYFRVNWQNDGRPVLTCAEEGLFFPDDLLARDPAGYALLEKYAAGRTPATDSSVKDVRAWLHLRSRKEFVRDVYLAALEAQATVVGFNLPFDLARIALDWGTAVAEGYEGGFSFLLSAYLDKDGVARPDTAVPRQLVRAFDSRRAKIGLGGVRPKSDPYAALRGSGSFLDLRTLTHAMSGDAQSLESACAAFNVPYAKRPVEHGRLSRELVDYCREDVEATATLYRALAEEYEHWHLQLAPTRAYSGASLAKAALREAGIQPIRKRQPQFPPEVIGYGMAAYFGGRAEARIRRLPVPVTTLDFKSMHPTIAVLQQLSRFLTCERIEVVEEPRAQVATLQRWLARLTIEDCLDPRFWPKLNGLVLVEPAGEILPVRARYSSYGRYGVGVNPLWSEEPLWFTLADVVASSLLTGRSPRALRVVRLVPRDRHSGMRPLRIRGSRPIDPYREDAFKALVEERRRFERIGDPESMRTPAALKVVANSAAYGIWAELNRQEPGSRSTRITTYGLDRFTSDVMAPEELGEYFFGLLAALVTGGARLILAILERLVGDAGGAWVMCDTDGMAVVSTQYGGLIVCPGGPERDVHGRECVEALSWMQVDEIVARFFTLNPYDTSVVPGSILSLEPENFDPSGTRRELQCYAISAKRYCLYTLTASGKPAIVKPSEHGLGGIYLDPTDPASESKDWVDEAWEWIVATDAVQIESAEPSWLDQPALSRFTASHPRLLKPFEDVNRDRPYAEQVKPFGFLLVAHLAPGGHPSGTPGDQVALVAPYDPDPKRWAQLPWRNIYDPTSPTYTLDTSSVFDRRGYSLAAKEISVLTYREVLRRFRVHPEPKSTDHEGRPCGRQTRGLLQRRQVRAIIPIAHIGKEANLLDEVAVGLVAKDEDALTVYVDRRSVAWDRIFLPVLREMNVRQTAAAVGVNPTTITRIRGGSHPRRALRPALMREIGRYARAQLREGGIHHHLDDEAAAALYRQFQPSVAEALRVEQETL